jgi:Na+/melibiose symporter-like transporter
MWPIEPIHYVHCTAPAALLFQNGTLDESVSIPDALRYQQAGSEPKTVLWYKASHGLGQEAFLDRVEWLKDLIGLTSYQTFPQSVEVALIVWLLLTVISLALLARDLWQARLAPRGVRLLWLLTTFFLGPLGFAAYLTSNPRFPVLTSPPQRALGSAAWASAGNIIGGIIVLGLLIYFPQVFGNNLILQITVLILLPLFIGWLIFATSRWLSRSDDRYLASFRRPVFAEVISTCLVLTGAYPTVVLLANTFFARWLGPFGLDLSYPPLWGTLCLATIAGTLVAYPFHLWMIQRGLICWGGAAEENSVRKLAWYLQAVLFLLASAVMIAAIMLSIQLSAQNA